MRRGAVRLLVSLLVSYFVGLAYFSLNAGIYWGLEGYGLLLIAAGVFVTLATRDKAKFGTGFLVFSNASLLFFLCVYVALVLDSLSIISLLINKSGGTLDFGMWGFSFGLYFLLSAFYQFGFSKKSHRFFLFRWAETNQNLAKQLQI